MGVAHAKSDLIAFLDQDDIWYPAHIAELSRPFEHHERAGVVYSSLDEIDGGTAICERGRFKTKPDPGIPNPNIAECLRADMHILPTAAIVRRSAIEAVGGFDERLSGYEDDDLFLRILHAGYSNSYLADPLGQWRRLSKDSSVPFVPHLECSRSIYAEKLYQMFPEHRRIIRQTPFPDGAPAALSRDQNQKPRFGTAILCRSTVVSRTLSARPAACRLWGALFTHCEGILGPAARN